MQKGLVDCHVHTDRSSDSQSPLGELCEKALELGLSGLSVTDHCEICTEGENRYWSYEGMRSSFENAREYGKQYAGRLKLLAGVELGQPMHNEEARDRLLAEHDYDIVLASVHYLRSGLDFYYLNYNGDCDPAEIYSQYLDELLETVAWGGFDSLAHLSYPLRYIVRREHAYIELSRYKSKYDEILSLLAEKGRALEINTHTLPDFPVPELELIKRFRELGGKLLTLGSDSHRVGELAGCFERGIELARTAGFDELVYFENRRPMSISII